MVNPSSGVGRNALVIIAVVVAGAALRWMADIITPFLLAIFLAVMVEGFARRIRQHAPRWPGGAAMTLAIILSAGGFGISAWVLANNAGDFLASLARLTPKLNMLLATSAHAVHFRGPHSVDQLFRRFDPTQYLGAVAAGLQGFAGSAIFVLVYLGFLIASRHTFERKAVRLFRNRETRQEALHLFLRVRDSVERYLLIQTLLGALIAGASWLVMVLVGLENALFWAFLVFLVNYVPIIGAIAAVVLPALFALLQFNGYSQAAIVLVGLWLITFVVGNILLPRMQGDSLNVDPLVVLLSLAFWGAVWGLTGMFLSTPLTVLVMVILAQFEGTRWIAILLSANGDPQGVGRLSEPGLEGAASGVTAP